MANSGKTGPGNFLIAISGARPEVLARCPTERTKFVSLGWAILITSGMATVSMWFALTSAMGFNAALSLPIAILWGLIIMGIDRWLVTSMSVDSRRKFAIAAPRLALAILLGSLISTPIVLRIFESEINNQISIIKENNEVTFLNSQERSAVATKVSQAQAKVTNLQQVIDTHGQQPINPANDPVVQGLTTQLTNERGVAAKDYQAWQCQLYGGCGSPEGDGPLAQASQRRYNADEALITTLTGEIQTREQQLAATDTTSEKNRLTQAEKALPTAQNQLVAAQGEETSLLDNFQSTNNATNGLLIRLKALDQLSAGDATLQIARLLLFLLFLFIEVLPVTVKLLQPQGNYEKILREEVANELKAARWDLRGTASQGPGYAGSFEPDDGLAPTIADGDFDPQRRRRLARDPIDAEVANVWTRVEPAAEWPSKADTTFLPREDDVTGPNRLDDLLRGLSDSRALGGYEEREGGIERHYGEEDL